MESPTFPLTTALVNPNPSKARSKAKPYAKEVEEDDSKAKPLAISKSSLAKSKAKPYAKEVEEDDSKASSSDEDSSSSDEDMEVFAVTSKGFGVDKLESCNWTSLNTAVKQLLKSYRVGQSIHEDP